MQTTHPIFDDLNTLKVSLVHKKTSEIRKIDFVYPNIDSRESSFLYRGNSAIQFNHKKQTNKAAPHGLRAKFMCERSY